MVAALAFFLVARKIFFRCLGSVFIYITISIARSKGRSGLLWGLLACFFPLITIIVLLLDPAGPQGAT